MNRLVSSRDNFVADPFLDEKPVKLSKHLASLSAQVTSLECYWPI